MSSKLLRASPSPVGWRPSPAPPRGRRCSRNEVPGRPGVASSEPAGTDPAGGCGLVSPTPAEPSVASLSMLPLSSLLPTAPVGGDAAVRADPLETVAAASHPMSSKLWRARACDPAPSGVPVADAFSSSESLLPSVVPLPGESSSLSAGELPLDSMARASFAAVLSRLPVAPGLLENWGNSLPAEDPSPSRTTGSAPALLLAEPSDASSLSPAAPAAPSSPEAPLIPAVACTASSFGPCVESPRGAASASPLLRSGMSSPPSEASPPSPEAAAASCVFVAPSVPVSATGAPSSGP
mmetsp:Transcript_28042/g.66599  ORF Transcript_28042/g.66599 Transcript_28042/m.66599 type:complete len:295 (-) Transcript_28042:949-1833(-)